MQTKKAFLKRVIEKGDALFNYSQEKKINHQFYYYYYHFNYKKKKIQLHILDVNLANEKC